MAGKKDILSRSIVFRDTVHRNLQILETRHSSNGSVLIAFSGVS